MLSQVLTGTTLTIGMGGISIPCTITLKSAEVGRKIEVSTNGGGNYFTVVPDITAATYIVTAIQAPITNIKVTGIANDILSVVS